MFVHSLKKVLFFSCFELSPDAAEELSRWHCENVASRRQTWCVCACIFLCWPGRVIRCAPPSPPVLLSEIQASPCHHCPAGASSRAPGCGVLALQRPSALLGPHWAPLGCNCENRQKANVTPVKGKCLYRVHASADSGIFMADLWMHTTMAATSTNTQRHAPVETCTQRAGPAQCLVSWVITAEQIYSRNSCKWLSTPASALRALQLWFTNPIKSIYDWE